MAKTIRARFSHGIIKPLEEVEFLEGAEFSITIPEVPKVSKKKNFLEALKATAGGWKGLIDAKELKRNIYADRLISNRAEVKL